MTRLRSTTIEGLYISSFFEMYVNTSQKDMNINNMSKRDRTILFHEYIHFLQDITTYYGLNNIYCYSEYIHSVVNRIYNHPTDKFPIPFKINDNIDNVNLNQQICNLTLGDSANITPLKISKIEISSDPIIDNKYNLKDIKSIILHLSNDDFVIFGALAIMESMAYILEKCCSPNDYTSSPEFPYCAAEKVADYYVTGFSSDLLMVLALCDMSLQNSNPGACFVEILIRIKCGDIDVKRPEDIYDYIYNQTPQMADGRQSKLFIDVLTDFAEIGRKSMKKYLQDKLLANSFHKWIDALIDFAIEWRINNKYFILDMARHKDLATNNYWIKAVQDIGTPLMSNQSGCYYKIPPNGIGVNMNVEYFKAMYEIEKVFEMGSCECALYDWCVSSPNSTYNELCKSAPWEKSKEKNLCPFATLWRHWNLSGKYPQV